MVFSKCRYKNSCFKCEQIDLSRFWMLCLSSWPSSKWFHLLLKAELYLIFSRIFQLFILSNEKKSKFLVKSASIPPVQKQSPEVIGKEKILKKLGNFTRKHSCHSNTGILS